MRHRPLDVLIVLIALIAQKVQKVQKEESKTAFLFLILSFSVLTTSDKQHTTLGQ